MLTTSSADGTVIAYDRIGSGPPLILVTGTFGFRKFPQTEKLAELLSRQYTVYNYDRRGRGDSGDSEPYAIEREIDDLDAMLDACGGLAYVFGLSSGAALALEAAGQLRNKIRRLAVYQPPFELDLNKAAGRRNLVPELTQLVAAGRRGAAVKLFMTKGFGMPGPLVSMFKVTPVWPKLTALAHTIPYDVTLLEQNWQTGKLPANRMAEIGSPTLVLVGGKSPAAVRDVGAAVVVALPCARCEVVAGQAHNVSAKALAPVLCKFFQG